MYFISLACPISIESYNKFEVGWRLSQPPEHLHVLLSTVTLSQPGNVQTIKFELLYKPNPWPLKVNLLYWMVFWKSLVNPGALRELNTTDLELWNFPSINIIRYNRFNEPFPFLHVQLTTWYHMQMWTFSILPRIKLLKWRSLSDVWCYNWCAIIIE